MENITLLFMDESGFMTLPMVQRSWSPIGQPHRADATEARRRINILGAFDYTSGRLHYVTHEGSVRRQDVENFLQSLAERSSHERPTLLILDNARMHIAISEKQQDRWLIEHGFLLCFLPVYSPELNLIEQLWKQVKYHWRRFKPWGATELKSKVTEMLDKVGKESKFNYA